MATSSTETEKPDAGTSDASTASSSRTPRLGLCSVTYRDLAPDQVIDLAADAGLDVIEWGSDIHVPAGDESRAREVGRATRTRGLEVCSYGTYWKAGTSSEAEFEDLIASALALGAPRLRVWAGVVGTRPEWKEPVATEDDWNRVTEALTRAVDQATAHDLTVAVECHPDTLTDTAEATERLLDAVPGLTCYWQPSIDTPVTQDLDALDRTLHRVVCGHVFAWGPGYDRHRLLTRSSLWTAALDRLVSGPRDLLLEFVPDDDPALLEPEAAVLRGWVHQAITAHQNAVDDATATGEIDLDRQSLAHKPVTLLVMSEQTLSEQFTPGLLGTLASYADLTDPVSVTGLDDPRVAEVLPRVEILLTSWGRPPLTDADLDRLPSLTAVIHAAGSVRGAIPDAAYQRGIAVSNAADINAFPVAEYTLAAILASGKHLVTAARVSRHRRRNEWSVSAGRIGNRGRTVGIVGFSRIGQDTIKLLRPHGMRILVADPYASADAVASTGAELVPLDELIPQVDVLSIHAPDTPETHNMIGAGQLAGLRDGATVINTARGRLLDHDALTRECASGRIDAILDVTWPEPLPEDSPLWDLDNVLITPHIAGSLGTEVTAMARSAIAEVAALAEGRDLSHRIDPATAGIQA